MGLWQHTKFTVPRLTGKQRRSGRPFISAVGIEGKSPLGCRWPEQRAEGAPGTDSYPGIPTMAELPPSHGF